MSISNFQSFEFLQLFLIENKIPTTSKFKENRNICLEAGPGYAHANFIGNSMIFDNQTVQKKLIKQDAPIFVMRFLVAGHL